MAEINYAKEKSWRIKEIRPIKATKTRNRHGDWSILIPPMTMTWDSYEEIFTSLSTTECYNISYDYEDGSPTLSVTDIGLVELQKMSEIIIGE